MATPTETSKETPQQHNSGRLSQLSKENQDIKRVGKSYSRFVKSMRLLLPLIAVGLIVVVATWSENDNRVVPVERAEVIVDTKVGENELLNPKFETTDSQQQPVFVSANRATQNQENPNLVRLEQINADFKMNDGSAISVHALNGTYEQKVEKLYLKDNVKIRHESGYQLNAEELRINMKSREAWSDKNVSINGPAGVINATGLEGNVAEGRLIFKGPATLKFNKGQVTSINTKQGLEE